VSFADILLIGLILLLIYGLLVLTGRNKDK